MAIASLLGGGFTPAGPEDRAIAFIEHAWAGDFEAGFTITGDDMLDE